MVDKKNKKTDMTKQTRRNLVIDASCLSLSHYGTSRFRQRKNRSQADINGIEPYQQVRAAVLPKRNRYCASAKPLGSHSCVALSCLRILSVFPIWRTFTHFALTFPCIF